MKIWSKLFGDPMRPLIDGIVKAVKQDTRGIAAYMNQPAHQRRSWLVLCEFEFLYFYLSCVDHVIQRTVDPGKHSRLKGMIQSWVIPQAIRAILGQIKTSVPTTLVNEYRGYAETKVPVYSRLQGVPLDADSQNLALEFLAMRIANLCANITDEEFQQQIIDRPFHEGVKSVVAYDLEKLNLENIVSSVAKSI